MEKLKLFIKNTVQLLSFILLISLYVIHQAYIKIFARIFKGNTSKASTLTRLYNRLIQVLDKERVGTISRINLIELSLKNMASKKTRTWVTMGGMAIGIGLIVLLVSIGYGLEHLVIDRVARLDELRQTDVVPGLSDELILNDKSIATFKDIPGVLDAIPVISSVGKVNYNNSETNMAVYGVTTQYLNESAIKPTRGKIFDSNELAVSTTYSSEDQVLGAKDSVVKQPNEKIDISPRVLGESDTTLPIVEIPSLSSKDKEENIITLTVTGREKRELVINRAALLVLGLKEEEAINKTIKMTFYIVDTTGVASETKTQSLETEYTILGVLPDDTTPVVYVPFVDLRSLGVTSYSQIKVITSDADTLPIVRSTIESSGYGTISVVDTVSQIDKLFSSVRIFLAILGIVALSVAALGMFNTLTVSLLERTHEVGLMKAIGMKSTEVKELFMTESMIMGFFGGLFGLSIGIIAGLLINLGVSAFSIAKGLGYLSITYVPIDFAIIIILLSLLIGVGTGYIPARRATRISALDALRYE